MLKITSFQMLSSLVVLLLASSPAVLAASSGDDDDNGLIHIPLYVHETLSGLNATVTPLTTSTLSGNTTFGSLGVVDDELRMGRARSSQLLGRFKGFVVGASRGVNTEFVSSATVVFTAGEYNGSTLSVEGHLPGSKGFIERAVVGGTGKFRLARGYSLTKTMGNTSPNTDVFQFDLFVLMHRSNCN